MSIWCCMEGCHVGIICFHFVFSLDSTGRYSKSRLVPLCGSLLNLPAFWPLDVKSNIGAATRTGRSPRLGCSHYVEVLWQCRNGGSKIICPVCAVFLIETLAGAPRNKRADRFKNSLSLENRELTVLSRHPGVPIVCHVQYVHA